MSAATVPAPQGTRFMVQWEEHPMHLATRLGYLLEHQSLVDVTLMCNTHTLKVHRSVLAACSPYFETVLQRQLGNHPLIVLKDMKFCVLKSLIEFMYCGETSVTEENLNPLMEAARFFEVKGLCTMSKEVLGGERPSPNKPVTTPVNGTMNSSADLIPATTYRGRGRRSGVGRGRRNLSTMLSPPSGGAPQSETAQIMLSLSGNPNGPTLQTTSRNVRISPTGHMGRPIQPASTAIPMRNGALNTTDLKALREQLNLEPRRRGRRRNYGFGRGRMKDLVEGKFGIQNIKKEPDEVQQKDGIIFKPLDSKVSLFNNNGNNDAKSPLLASLLSKAEALAKAKVKTEKNDNEEGTGEEQETVVYQFDGESSGASKYLDALKEAGLPTDVPVLIDNGDGNYVTLTEDVLMNVLGNNEEFQFQVTEATLEQGDVSEGVVLQDGTIMMTGKRSKSDTSGPLLTLGRKSVSVREVKGKRAPRQRQSKDTAKGANKNASPKKNVKKEPAAKKSELISDEVLESLKNGAASEAEADPDAVVLFEVTDNHKVCKYVVSSKEISALKALNEQIEKQKKQNSPSEKKDLVPTVVDGNTNIAEIKLNFPKNSRKSIVSEVLARAHSLENQVKENQVKTDPLTNLSKNYDHIKNEVNSPQIIDINMGGDSLNDTSELIGLSPSRNNLENPNTLDLGEDPQILDESNSMVELHRGSQFMHISDGQHEGIALSENENLIIVNSDNQLLQQDRDDVTEARSEDSQIMQINECSQDGGDGDTETTQEGIEEINDEDMNALESSGRDMPILESESQLVELEFIDGHGEKVQRYRLEGNVLSQKISELTELGGQGKNAEVIGLLDMVCEEAAAGTHGDNQMLETIKQDVNNEELITINQAVPCTSAITLNVSTVDNGITRSNYRTGMTSKNQITSRSDHIVLVEAVNNEDSRHFDSLDDGECQVLSVEEATNQDHLTLEEAMKGIVPRHLETDVITLDESDCQLSAEQSRTEDLLLEDSTNIDSRQLDVGSMSLDDEECQLSAEPASSESLVLEVKGEDTSHLKTGEITRVESNCQEFTVNQISLTEHVMLEDDVDNVRSTRDLESDVMSLDEGTSEGMSANTRPEHFELEDAVKNIDSRHLESGELSLDEGDCQEISVEQALQAMMGDSDRNRTEQENQESCEEIKSLNYTNYEDENKLEQLTESSKGLNNPNDFEIVYEPLENSIEGETLIQSEIETQIVLGEEHVQNDATGEDEMMKEGAESTVISPTKDVPFAVGLVPLKDALVQIQSIPDHQPRKTRSSSTSKQEVVGSKRRSSMENTVVGSAKRRKSLEDENPSKPGTDAGNVVNTT